MHADCNLDIGYMKMPSIDNDFKITVQLSREAIWCNILKFPLSEINLKMKDLCYALQLVSSIICCTQI